MSASNPFPIPPAPKGFGRAAAAEAADEAACGATAAGVGCGATDFAVTRAQSSALEFKRIISHARYLALSSRACPKSFLPLIDYNNTAIDKINQSDM